MKSAELLPSVFYGLCLSACMWALLDLVQKSHKPEVEGSSPSLTTTLLKNNQTQQTTVYAVISDLAYSSFLTIKQGAQLSHFFLFSSFLAIFAEFYCRVTAESATLFYVYKSFVYLHPP